MGDSSDDKKQQINSELSHSEKFLHSIIENIPYMIFVKEAEELRFVRLNGAGERLLGFSREELIGKNDYDFFPREQADFFTANDREVLEGRAVRAIEEEPIDTREYGRRILSTKKIPIFDEKGQPQFLLGISEDVTEKRQAQEALRESEERFRNAFDNAPIGFALIAGDGRYLRVNQALCDIIGYSAEELTSKNSSEITHPEDVAICTKLYQDFESGRIDNGKAEKRYLHKNGYVVWTQFYCTASRDASGALRYIIGQIQDVSQEKLLVSQLEEAKKTAEAAALAKSQFLANMSHEIRTPLNGVVGLIDLLSDIELEEGDKELAEMCKTSASWLLTIIDEILDFSKLEAGRVHIHQVVFDLPALMKGIERMLMPTCLEKSLRFEVRLADDLPQVVVGDPDRLQQVLMNLLSNAVKFTPQGGSLALAVARDTGDGASSLICFRVEDTGIGIAKDVQKEIFEPFSQADSTITKQYGGTGLGLAICRQLTQRMGGQIRVASEVGKGSCFSVTLPLKEGSSASLADSVAHHVELQFNRVLSILVVEDNPVNQKLFERLLMKEGHTVTLADDGRSGLEIARRGTFDIILMDIQMPEMSGEEVVRCLREEESSQRNAVPIVAVTAHALAGDRERLLEQGFNDYLSKPIERRKLLQIIKQLTNS